MLSKETRLASVLVACTYLVACGGGNSPGASPVDSSSTGNSGLTSEGADLSSGAGGIPVGSALAGEPAIDVALYSQGILQVLSDDEFASLTPVEQYRVANQLSSTFYRGIPLEDFLDVSAQYEALLPEVSVDWVSDYHQLLQTPLTDQTRAMLDEYILGSEELDLIDGDYQPGEFEFSNERPRELPLARIFSYPTSLDQASQWMAWHLANTLLFSPSAELDSAGMTYVQNVMRRLDKAILANQSVSDVVFEHMRSLENWRRFRSPEDNTREMICGSALGKSV